MDFAMKNLLCLIGFLPLAESGDMPFTVICLIYLLGVAILIVEVFAPGGFLGVIGITVIVGSITLAFWYHSDRPYLGIALLVISLVILPSIAIWMLRRLTLSSAQNLEDGYTASSETLDGLLGKEGVTTTPLRPSGMANIDNKRIDVTSENVMLEQDTPIKVFKIEGNRVVVRATGSPRKKED